MITNLIVWAIFGLVIGAIARLLMPGRQSMGLLMTMFLGIVGSFLGGFVAFLFAGGEPVQAAGWIMSILGAIVVLWIGIGASGRQAV